MSQLHPFTDSLLTGCIAAYNNTTKLGHAYGVCVVLVTFITTSMVALVALIVWRLPLVVVIAFYLVFGSLDGVYLSSTLTKVPNGAWFTLALAVILSSVFVLWRFGKEQQWKAETEDRFPLSHLLEYDQADANITNNDDGLSTSLRLTSPFGGHKVTPIRGIGIFFDKIGQPATTPAVFIHFLEKFRAAPEVVVFFHLRPVHMPTIPPEERYTITRCSTGRSNEPILSTDETGNEKEYSPLPNCFRLVIRHGYMDVVVTSDLGLLVFEQLRNFVIKEALSNRAPTQPQPLELPSDKELSADATTVQPHSSTHSQKVVSARLTSLQSAWSSQVVYIVGKEQLRIKQPTGIFRRGLLSTFLWLRENSRTKMQSLNVGIEKLVEIGFVKEI